MNVLVRWWKRLTRNILIYWCLPWLPVNSETMLKGIIIKKSKCSVNLKEQFIPFVSHILSRCTVQVAKIYWPRFLATPLILFAHLEKIFNNYIVKWIGGLRREREIGFYHEKIRPQARGFDCPWNRNPWNGSNQWPKSTRLAVSVANIRTKEQYWCRARGRVQLCQHAYHLILLVSWCWYRVVPRTHETKGKVYTRVIIE